MSITLSHSSLANHNCSKITFALIIADLLGQIILIEYLMISSSEFHITPKVFVSPYLFNVIKELLDFLNSESLFLFNLHLRSSNP